MRDADQLTFVELFAGIGLVRLALESKGLRCVMANDIDEKKRDAYLLNFSSDDFLLGDVWGLAEGQLPDRPDLLTASFPCTDLSVAGHGEGLAGKESSAFWGVVRLLKMYSVGASVPCVLLENVVGFMTSHRGKDFVEAMAALSELGYYIDAFVLDACRFTPQSRPRLFVIAVQEELADQHMARQSAIGILDEWTQRIESETSFDLRPAKLRSLMSADTDISWGALALPAPPRAAPTTLKDIVEELPVGHRFWWDEGRVQKLVSQMSPLHQGRLQAMTDSPTPQYGTVYRRMRKGRSMAELRTDGVAGCLRTPKGGSSRQILVEAWNGEVKARLLTAREYGRLQGVPDTFSIPENQVQGCFGFGDAVCVPAVAWIAENVICPLLAGNLASQAVCPCF